MKDMVLISISIEELEAKFAQVVEDKLKAYLKIPNQNNSKDDPEYGTRKEVAKKLHISLPTLNSLTKEGKLIGYRIGNRLLYKWEEVEKAVQQIQTQKHKRLIVS